MNTIKDILEILYYLSAPLIAFIAFRGLKQISVTKEIAKMNAKREAYKITIIEVRFYSDNIIPLCDNLDNKIKKHDIKFFTNSKVDYSNDRIEVIPVIEKDLHEKKILLIAEDVQKLINQLTSFSLFFTSGIGDEQFAFSSIGQSYCSIIKKIAPALRTIPNDDSIIKLFFLWHRRISKEIAITEKDKLDRFIQKTQDDSIKPIGT